MKSVRLFARSTHSLRRLTSALGVEVRGLDLSKPLAPSLVITLKDLIKQHLVVTIPGQIGFEPGHHDAFARAFGQPEPHSIVKGRPDYPDIIEWTKDVGSPTDFGESWHTDNSFTTCPSSLSILYGIEIPPYGNDTVFANMYLAYEGLSKGLQELLRSLNAVHSAAKAFNYNSKERQDRFAGAEDRKYDKQAEVLAKDVVHPVVRTHPETGRKLLYVNQMFTTRFDNMTEAESLPLLQYLWTHLSRPEYQCRVAWTPNQLTIWDNRPTQNMAINDNFEHRRRMRRISLKGEHVK